MSLTNGDILTGGLALASASAEVLIAAGVLTISAGGLTIVGAQSGATDDLDTVNIGTGLIASGYQLIVFLTATIGDTITIKNGTGNIVTNTGADVSLTSAKVAMLIRFIGTTNSVVTNTWKCIA